MATGVRPACVPRALATLDRLVWDSVRPHDRHLGTCGRQDSEIKRLRALKQESCPRRELTVVVGTVDEDEGADQGTRRAGTPYRHGSSWQP